MIRNIVLLREDITSSVRKPEGLRQVVELTELFFEFRYTRKTTIT